MNYLLDTHSFLWALMDPDKLSAHTTQILASSANEILLSVISFWEISLKFSLGKLDLKGITPAEMPPAARKMRLTILPIESEDAATYHTLRKTIHKDPFDRMIVWQCIRRQWPLISSDGLLDLYKSQGLILVR
jgi:PIN domain nuclease of toxin-antitoxin system